MFLSRCGSIAFVIHIGRVFLFRDVCFLLIRGTKRVSIRCAGCWHTLLPCPVKNTEGSVLLNLRKRREIPVVGRHIYGCAVAVCHIIHHFRAVHQAYVVSGIAQKGPALEEVEMCSSIREIGAVVPGTSMDDNEGTGRHGHGGEHKIIGPVLVCNYPAGNIDRFRAVVEYLYPLPVHLRAERVVHDLVDSNRARSARCAALSDICQNTPAAQEEHEDEGRYCCH